jgi:hypothetical protein
MFSGALNTIEASIFAQNDDLNQKKKSNFQYSVETPSRM